MFTNTSISTSMLIGCGPKKSNFLSLVTESSNKYRYSMPSAKQQPLNIKHGGGIRPNVWVLTFGPTCIYFIYIWLTTNPQKRSRMKISGCVAVIILVISMMLIYTDSGLTEAYTDSRRRSGGSTYTARRRTSYDTTSRRRRLTARRRS